MGMGPYSIRKGDMARISPCVDENLFYLAPFVL
jgi:hypothetical protein